MDRDLYRRKILIVDDDPTSIKILESMLPAEQYEISRGRSSGEALDAAFERPPDLILLDVLMPGIAI